MKLQHSTLVFLSGLIWFFVGVFLLPLGLNLITGAAQQKTSDSSSVIATYPIMDNISSYVGGRDQVALLLIALGLALGYSKGKYVLGKSARQGIARIISLPNPSSVWRIYTAKYYLLLGSMVLLGIMIKVFQLSPDIRGFVDVTIGAALINGALVYFRSAYDLKKKLRHSHL